MKESMPTPDLFDDEFLKIGSQWGKTEAEKLAERRERVLTDDALARGAKSAVELQKAWEERLGVRLSKASDATDWDTIRVDAGRSGAPQEVIDLFGEDFSPEAQKRAASIARGESKAAGSDDAQALERYAARLNKSVADLSQDEEDTFVKDRAAAKRDPDRGRSTEILPATRAVAIRSRDKNIREINEGRGNAKAKADAINMEWLSYYEQINQPVPAKVQQEIELRDLDADWQMRTKKKPVATDPEYAAARAKITGGGGRTATATTPGAPPPAAKPAPTSITTKSGKTIVVGQTVFGPDGKPRVVTGFTPSGQVITHAK
jgi:hypothetical protein